MQFPITIGLHRSRFLDLVLLIVAVTASCTALRFPRTSEIQGGLVLAIWVICGLAWQRLRPGISAIRLERSGQVFIRPHRQNDFVATRLLPGGIVHPWLTVIGLKTDDRQRHTLIVGIGSVSREDFRRLRVFFRWQARFNEPDDGA